MDNIKQEMRTRARLLRGLASAFTYDADYIKSDVDNYDILCMNESIKEAKNTIEKITDGLTELEYMLYLLKREEA